MNKDTLIFIDAYISDFDRVGACANLIKQIREYYPEYKLALLNKYPDSWKLDSLVDYYFYYGDSIMVGKPPQHLLDNKLYELGYVYVNTSLGTCENWVPLVGVTDHVASIYNGFIFSARIAKSLGFKKVFKIEYDSILDPEEAQFIKKDLPEFQDYLLYGKRQEGQWAKDYHYLVDIHAIGYSVDLFDGFDYTLTDEAWWDLCKRIKYYGKWIEYIIPAVIETQRKNKFLEGIVYEGKYFDIFPNTSWDIINSPSYWTEKWNNQPKICRLSYDSGKTESNNEAILFFWNEEEKDLEIECKIYNSKNEIVFSKDVVLKERCWVIDSIPLTEELRVVNKNTRLKTTKIYESFISPETIKDLPTRFLYEKST